MNTSSVVFFLIVVGGFSGCVLSTLLLEELKSINYEVDIGKTPVRTTDETSLPTVQVRSKHGQTYQCLLPQIEDSESLDKKEGGIEDNIDIKELLKPFKIGSCLLKTKDWWTYEFCYGNYIKQYHIEDGKIIGPVITLGIYESDYDWNNKTEEHQARFRHVKQRYHSQTYINGTECDLTSEPRTAEVRFFCEDDAGDYIYRVDEPGTCTYILTVHTSRLCAHPKLRPMPSSRAHVISCSPLLDEEEYAEYLQKLDEEKNAAEEKRNNWLTNQQERLNAIKTQSEDSSAEEEVKPSNDQLPLLEFKPVEVSSPSAELMVISDDTDVSKDFPAANDLPKKKPVRTIEEEFEIRLFQEYKDEVHKWKYLLPSQRYDAIKDYIGNQLNSIIDEAGGGIKDHINKNSKEVIVHRLATVLTNVLDKVDQYQKEAAKNPESLQTSVINKEAQDDDQGDFNPIEQFSREESAIMEKINSVNRILTAKLSAAAALDDVKSSLLDDDKLHVRIRRLDKKSPDSTGELQEMDFAQRTKLEQAIKEQLEKSGVDTGGRRIEVKIITAGYYDNEDGNDFHALSDEETIQFQNMIMALLTGQQEAVHEMEKHKKLEDNYNFVWESNDLSLLEDDDE